MKVYRVWVNQLPYMGEDLDRTYSGGEPWSGNSWQTKNSELNVLNFGHLGGTPKPIVGDRGLKSELDRIVRRSQDKLLVIYEIRITSEESLS